MMQKIKVGLTIVMLFALLSRSYASESVPKTPIAITLPCSAEDSQKKKKIQTHFTKTIFSKGKNGQIRPKNRDVAGLRPIIYIFFVSPAALSILLVTLKLVGILSISIWLALLPLAIPISILLTLFTWLLFSK